MNDAMLYFHCLLLWLVTSAFLIFCFCLQKVFTNPAKIPNVLCNINNVFFPDKTSTFGMCLSCHVFGF